MSLSRLACSRIVFPVSGPFLSSIRQLTTSTVRSARFGGGGSTGRFAEQFGIKAKAGPTLRERLLGPTTGKPFIYGTYALSGASVFGIGMLCYYGLGMSKGMSVMDKSALWPEYVRTRLHHTYAYLAGGLGITAGAGLIAGKNFD
uniref:Growth hormone-inducible transmembrane protein n=1 Tax=Panagrolaimus sp. ES5 TaxID=591445 RepID=A0AC34FP98_9BILA